MTRNAQQDLRIFTEAGLELSPGPWSWDHWHDKKGMPYTQVFDAKKKTIAKLNNLTNAACMVLGRTALPYWIKRALRAEARLQRLKPASRKKAKRRA